MRESTIQRRTKETEIDVALHVEGTGQVEVDTGIGMLDHMVEQLARHGGFDLTLKASGDLSVDSHHTVEDIGLCLGQAFNEALGDRAGVARMADRTVPLDEALVQVVLDLSGRPYSEIGLTFRAAMVGELPTQMVTHLLQSCAPAARITLHVRQLAGENDHHILEAAFKALARAMRDAVTLIESPQSVPSTKGTLTS
jgi:imidazoleglycerol-phosphate dehydratase